MIPTEADRVSFFSDLGLTKERLAELAEKPDFVVKYFAPICHPEGYELSWRHRVAEAHRIADSLPDVVERVRGMPCTSKKDWGRIISFLSSPNVEKRLGLAHATFGGVLNAAGVSFPSVDPSAGKAIAA